MFATQLPAQAAASPSAEPRAEGGQDAAPSQRTTPGPVMFQGEGLGTKIQLAAYEGHGLSRASIERAFAAALGEMQRLDTLLSDWKSTSDVGRVNQSPGSFVPIDRETAELVAKSLWISRLSEGAFDITFQGMSPLWKFGDAAEHPPRVPTAVEVERARKHVDYRRLELDGARAKLKIGAGQQIGLGGIAKGYIVDRMARVLKHRQLTSFLVQAGGDLVAIGAKPDGSPWTTGIQDPRAAWGSYFATLVVEDAAVSTAGDYARAYVVGGRRYHHIIDPKTGYPAQRCRSVSVWAPTGLQADAIDDAVFIMGPTQGLELVESLPGVGAVIVDSSNQLWISKRLIGKVKIAHLPTDGL